MEHNFEANFFTLLELLDPGSRLEIEGLCTKISFPPNHFIYEQGAPANAVYIVSSGVVEALTKSPDGKKTRSIGFMGRGDFFGDLAILTGLSRLASVRTCEPVKLLQMEKTAFLRLLEKVPKMGAYFSRNLARRLYQTSTEAHRDVYGVDLAGNLQHFDLLTIFQAITSICGSGELKLNNSGNELIGSFFFRKGKVQHARFAHLSGIEAIWQGFVQLSTDGTFVFRVMPEPIDQFGPETRIEMDSTNLIMQGASLRDTYDALPASMRLMEGKLNRLGGVISWQDEETRELAVRIWDLISKRPQSLDSIWRRLQYSSITFLEAVKVLVETKQAEILPNEPVAEKTA